MAIEKVLNTRILNKIDTLEAWQSSTLEIKEGEICIATVAASAGTGLTEPVCMIKIGTKDENGNLRTFKDLPWSFYAKSSDVLSVCKSAEDLEGFVNGVIAKAGIASSDAMTALAGKVTAAEGKISALETIVGGAEDGLVKDVAALEKLVGDTEVAIQITNAITELDLANTYEAKGEAAKVQTALDTYKTSNDAAVKANSDAIAANTSSINGIKDGTTIDSFADVETALAGKEASGAAAQALADSKTYADGLAGNYDKKGSAAEAETNAKNYADSLADGYDKAGDAAQALTDAKDYTDAQIEEWVGDKTVGVQIENAITGLDLANTYDAKGTADAVDKKLTAHVTEAEGKYETKTDASDKLTEAKGYTDTEVGKVQSEVDALEDYVGTFTASEGVDTVVKYIDAKTANIASDETVGAIDDRLKTIEGDYLKKADKEELAGDIAEVSGLIGGTAVSEQIENAVKTERERAEGIEAGLRTDVDAIKGDYLKAADKEAIQSQIDLIMNNPDTEKVINSISEFTAYIDEHGEIAEGMRSDINKNKEDIAAEVTRATGVEGGLDTRLKAVEAAVGESGSVADDIAGALTEAKGYTDAEVKELAEGTVATNAAAIAALEGKVGDKTVSEQITDVTNPLAERVVALEAIDHDHSNKTVLDGIEETDVTAWDAKVDDVTAAADSGLKATRTGNAVAIEIDDTVTFIFDCGGAE